ncbi:PAS domain S-box protein [Siccirubricoccus sp. KC 17139]|uniref:histidine kinase n=1 Tax=Siccirubricoccus soli TaxID=2899147 RepID=A0ABT1DAN9_9PROT|nr:HWE histidine kinase domain-containing protein [Siccirubricoccus soli]MCO6419008.1 PAS domain S-box protein [Siccirubricoccus soli]MCP2685143.1 PAS domain S-box protein [Siccirubricoccus soli]
MPRLQGRSHSALILVLGFVLAVPTAAAVAAAWFTWRITWREAEEGVARSADTIAEYALRILDSQRLGAGRVNDLVRGMSDAEIRAHEAEVHAGLRALVPAFPMVETATILGADGAVLATARVYPVLAEANAADREWVQALRRPETPEPHISRVVRSRFDDHLFFPVSIRRTGTGNAVPPGGIEGIITLSVGPEQLTQGFGEVLGLPENIIALLRQDGAILARRPLPAGPFPDLPPDSDPVKLAASGVERAIFLAPSTVDGARTLFAMRNIAGFPVLAIVGRSVSEIHRAWFRAVRLQLTWGGPAMLMLLGSVLYALRLNRKAWEAEWALQGEQARRAALDAREAAEARFRGVFHSRAMGMAVFDLQTGQTLLANDRLLEMTGSTREAFARGEWDWRRYTPVDDLRLDEAALAEAQARGWFDPYEKEYLRPDGSRLPVRLFSAPLPGEPGRIVAIVQDISEQREAETKRDLLVREVNHRAKNALATVQAVLRLTTAESLEAYRTLVQGRVAAVAQAMDLLAQTGWTRTSLPELIRGEFQPFLAGVAGRGTVPLAMAGPEVFISPAMVQPLAMALHELATNAAKYGALSQPGGTVRITWRVTPQNRLLLDWEEQGGPALAGPPARQGFGTRMLHATVERQLHGRVSWDWRESGLLCRISVPQSCVEVEQSRPAQVG